MPLELQGLESGLVAQHQLKVELEEEDDGHHYYNVEHDCPRNDDDRDDKAGVGGPEVGDEGGEGEEEDEGVDEGEEDGVEEHEEEELAVVEADARVDPGAGWGQGYQWWSMFRTHRLHDEQWCVLSGLYTWQMRQYFRVVLVSPNP